MEDKTYYQKVLTRDVIIRAGVFITDDPNLQPVTKLQKALDDYIRALPEDYFAPDTGPAKEGQ